MRRLRHVTYVLLVTLLLWMLTVSLSLTVHASSGRRLPAPVHAVRTHAPSRLPAAPLGTTAAALPGALLALRLATFPLQRIRDVRMGWVCFPDHRTRAPPRAGRDVS